MSFTYYAADTFLEVLGAKGHTEELRLVRDKSFVNRIYCRTNLHGDDPARENLAI